LKDDSFAQVFRDGRDIYREIAARALSKGYDDISESERQNGKVWFLMSLYGAGPKKVAASLGITHAEAREFYNDFHDGLPQLRALSNPPPRTYRNDYAPGSIERAIRKRGYLRTPWGRHLHVPQYGEHKMLNTLIQGSAADLMKVSLVRVDDYLRAEGVESRMVATIHDEIMLDGPLDEIPALNERIPALMREDFLHAVVPIEVEHEVSTTTWADKVPYEDWKEGT
jgi:DNA polymerase-1